MKLYKYVSAERIQILEKDQIRFTQPFEWNDPFEAQVLSSNENTKLNRYNQILNYFFAFLSISKSKNHLLMWSHYTKNHEGFLIGIETKGMLVSSKPTLLIKLKYPEKRQMYDYDTAINILNKLYNYLKGFSGLTKDDKNSITSLFSKSKCWEYENEYRLITLSEYADKVISKKTEKEIKKNKYQTYTNYDKRTGKVESDSVYLYSLRPESIFCVYFGCDTDIKVERRINKLLNSEQKKHVLYYKAVLNKNEYKLNYRKLKYEDLLNIKDLLKYKET